MRVANELPYPVLSGPVNKSTTSRNDLFLMKTDWFITPNLGT